MVRTNLLLDSSIWQPEVVDLEADVWLGQARGHKCARNTKGLGGNRRDLMEGVVEGARLDLIHSVIGRNNFDCRQCRLNVHSIWRGRQSDESQKLCTGVSTFI